MRARPARHWLSLAAIAGPVLFTVAWIFLGAIRTGYSPVSQPISALAIGPRGGIMQAAFLLNGLLVAVGLIAASRSFRHQLGAASYRACTAMLLLSPLGFLWSGIFTMNHLTLHTIGAEVALGTAVIAFPIAGLLLRRVPGWRRFGSSMASGGLLLTVALLAGFMNSVPFTHMATGGGSYGLWQRALVVEVQAWYVAMGWLALHRSQPPTPH